jgi:hypothetical protein
MNSYVLQVKNRIPPGVRPVLAVIYCLTLNLYRRAINFFPALLAIGRSTCVLASHVSADFVPGFYWRRVRRFAGTRRS